MPEEGQKMKILCLDDEPLALKMLETCVKQVRPEAEVISFDDQDDLLEEAENKGANCQICASR